MMDVRAAGPRNDPLLPWKYRKYPEGTHFYHKLYASSMYGLLGGFSLCSIDFPLGSKPQSLIAGFNRAVHLTTPCLGGAVAFTTASFAACRLRGKDDALNWGIGGAAAGSVYGAWVKCSQAGFGAALIFAIIASGVKLVDDLGGEIFPAKSMRTREIGTLNTMNYDFTVFRDPKNDPH